LKKKIKEKKKLVKEWKMENRNKAYMLYVVLFEVRIY